MISFITWNLHFFVVYLPANANNSDITVIKLDAKVNRNDVQVQPARFIDWYSTAAS